MELFFHQPGAVTRVGVEDTAFPHRSPSWDFDALAQWFEPEQADLPAEQPRRETAGRATSPSAELDAVGNLAFGASRIREVISAGRS